MYSDKSEKNENMETSPPLNAVEKKCSICKNSTTDDSQKCVSHKENTFHEKCIMGEPCAICQDAVGNEKYRIIDCGHFFHYNCITKWIECRNLCPLCNKQADETQPVRQLNSDDEQLSLRTIQSLLRRMNQTGGLIHPAHSIVPILLGGIFDSYEPYIYGGGEQVTRPRQRRRNDNAVNSNEEEEEEDGGDIDGNHNDEDEKEDLRSLTNVINTINNTINSRVASIRSGGSFFSSQPGHNSSTCSEQAQCAYCYRLSCIHNVKRCTGCKQILYCGTICHRNHWPEHREWCLSNRSA